MTEVLLPLFTRVRRASTDNVLFFSALHGMPARSSDEKGVRPSVCLSVRQRREL